MATSDQGPWDHLPKPFSPARVVQYQTGYAFAFKARDGEEYYNRSATYNTVNEARVAMGKFCKQHNARS